MTIQFCRRCTAIRTWVVTPQKVPHDNYLLQLPKKEGKWKFEAHLDEKLKRGMIEGWGNTIVKEGVENDWVRTVD